MTQAVLEDAHGNLIQIDQIRGLDRDGHMPIPVEGLAFLVTIFVCLMIIGYAVLFLFRWKTKAWTQSWGPYKKLTLSK